MGARLLSGRQEAKNGIIRLPVPVTLYSTLGFECKCKCKSYFYCAPMQVDRGSITNSRPIVKVIIIKRYWMTKNYW